MQVLQSPQIASPRAFNPPLSPEQIVQSPRSTVSRASYILLGLLPGILISIFGINNLIAGYVGKGVTQLLLSIMGIYGLSCAGVFFPPTFCISVPLWLGMLIWTIVEVCTVQTDAMGRSMT